jgi:hypothetical protein
LNAAGKTLLMEKKKSPAVAQAMPSATPGLSQRAAQRRQAQKTRAQSAETRTVSSRPAWKMAAQPGWSSWWLATKFMVEE